MSTYIHYTNEQKIQTPQTDLTVAVPLYSIYLASCYTKAKLYHRLN